MPRPIPPPSWRLNVPDVTIPKIHTAGRKSAEKEKYVRIPKIHTAGRKSAEKEKYIYLNNVQLSTGPITNCGRKEC